MKKMLYILLIILFLVYQLFYKLSFIYKGELYQYILNPLIIFIFVLIFNFFFYKNKDIKLKYNRQVRNIVIINSLIYLIIYFTIGFFTGFVNNPYAVNLNGFIMNLFSIIFVYFLIELFREILVRNIKRESWYYYLFIFFLFLIFEINYSIFDNLNFKNLILELMPVIINNIFLIYLVTKTSFITNFIHRVILFSPFLVAKITPDIDLSIFTLLSMLLPLLSFIMIEYSIKAHDKYIPSDIKESLSPRRWITTFTLIIVVIFFTLGVFGVRPVVILTNSMQPAIKPGDLVIIKTCSIEDVDVGDIIEFQSDNYQVIHRVVDITKNKIQIQLTTKGDNNKDVDLEKIRQENLRGCFSFKIRYLGYPSYLLRNIFSSR